MTTFLPRLGFLGVACLGVLTIMAVLVLPAHASDTDHVIRGEVYSSPESPRPLADVLIVLTGQDTHIRVSNRVRMDQVDRRFVPTILPVAVGTTVIFENSDTFVHNVRLMSLSENKRLMNQSVYHGETVSYRFSRPDVVRVKCDVHPTMKARVLVLKSPFKTTRSDTQGRFRLRAPEVLGPELTLRAWAPRRGFSSPETIHLSTEKGRVHAVRLLLGPRKDSRHPGRHNP